MQTSVKIVILGAGGTGGYLLPHLYRIAYAAKKNIRIIVCDGDIVKEKNLIRQNFIEQDIGQNKAKVLAERYASAFGMKTEYLSEFIEKADKLYRLLKPDSEKQIVVLIGAVDNHKSRKICHEAFCRSKNLIYIDSGNGLQTGQVVCGIRKNGQTVFPPAAEMFPDILQNEQDDLFPSELSCAEQSVSSPQSIAANITAAAAVVSFVYDLLVTGSLKTKYVTFSSRLINMRAELSDTEYIQGGVACEV